MERWLKRILGKRVRRGTLKVSLGPKRSFRVGDGTGKPIAIAFDSTATLLWILTDPDFKLGEAYMDGSFRVTEGSLADFLDLVEAQNPASPTLASLEGPPAYPKLRRVAADLATRQILSADRGAR